MAKLQFQILVILVCAIVAVMSNEMCKLPFYFSNPISIFLLNSSIPVISQWRVLCLLDQQMDQVPKLHRQVMSTLSRV